MIKTNVAVRYAKVLFEMDKSSNYLEKRMDEFSFLIELMKSHPKVLRFLKAPHLSHEQKTKMMAEILAEHCDATFLSFFSYLIENKRLDELANIALSYQRLVYHANNIWKVEMITAVSLDKTVENTFKEKLERHFNKKMMIHSTVDPKIVGGVILIIVNKVLDWSVTGRLKRMKTDLMKVSHHDI